MIRKFINVDQFVSTTSGLSSGDIGTIVLVAQITDAIANPSVGILIEHLKIPLFGFVNFSVHFLSIVNGSTQHATSTSRFVRVKEVIQTCIMAVN